MTGSLVYGGTWWSRVMLALHGNPISSSHPENPGNA